MGDERPEPGERSLEGHSLEGHADEGGLGERSLEGHSLEGHADEGGLGERSLEGHSLEGHTDERETTEHEHSRKATRHTTSSRATTAIGASKRRLAPGSRRIGAAPPDEWAEVTVIVRPRSSVPLPSVEELGRQPLAERRHVDLRAFVDVYGADPKDLAAVAAFARNYRLQVVESSVARRSVALEGTVADMASCVRHQVLALYVSARRVPRPFGSCASPS